ncbi:hypothetical protein HDU97_010194 [Phlyctochytrium planicorne]|nr:hypothetical protein HDU97_010194 [Phlyctochytrium planicorne]
MVVDVEDEKDVERLRGMVNVKRVIPVHRVSRPDPTIHFIGNLANTTPTSQNPDHQPILKKRSHRFQKRDNLANDLSSVTPVTSTPGDARGAGIRVCVIDTGVDYKHPALGGCFGPGCKVGFGYDFVGDDYDPYSMNISLTFPIPKDDPMDCWGHGTHVSGIIAASDVENKGIEGVAPNATLGVYKVFGCNGDSDTGSVLAAMDQSFFDDCSILNLSLGAGAAWSDTPDAMLADLLTSTGEIVVSSAGNDQDLGIFRVGSPATSSSTTAVGAVENSKYPGRTFSVVNDTRQIPFTFPSGNPPDSDMLPIALIRRGTCTFSSKIKNAHNASAIGVIIYNRLPEALGDVPNPYKSEKYPVYTISGVDGEFLMDMISKRGKKGNVSISFNQTDTYFDIPDAGRVAEFSSWGPALDWTAKPDVVAPGGHIASTWLTSEGKYAVLSGTSMASPFQAGAYALLLASYPGYKLGLSRTEPIKAIMKVTANPTYIYNGTRGYTPPLLIHSPNTTTFGSITNFTKGPNFSPNVTTYEVLAPVALQGSGLLNITAAINCSTLFTETSFSANITRWDKDGNSTPSEFTLDVLNDDVVSKTYTVDFQEAAIVAMDDPVNPSIYAPLFPSVTLSKSNSTETGTWNGSTKVTVTPARFTLGPSDKVTLSITIQGPTKLEAKSINETEKVWMYSGYLLIRDSYSNSFTITLTGVTGNFSSQLPLSTKGTKAPYIAPLSALLTNQTSKPYDFSQENLTVDFRTISTTLIDPSTNSSTDIVFLPDLFTINIHLRLPSPLVRVIVFHSNVSQSEAIKRLQDTVNIEDTSFLPQDAVAASPTKRLPPNDLDDDKMALFHSLTWDGSPDFKSGASTFPMTPPPNSPNSTLEWDPKLPTLGPKVPPTPTSAPAPTSTSASDEEEMGPEFVYNPVLVPNGFYRIAIAIQGVYGNFGPWSGWVSPVFQALTGVDA